MLRGLGVDVTRPAEVVTRIVDISIPPPPPPVVEVKPREIAKSKPAAAAPALPAPKGGPKGPAKVKQVQPDVTRVPYPVPRPVAPAGGGQGSGTALGAGAGGGTGGDGNGDGDGEGGGDLEQIAGDIDARDYPRDLGRSGISGRVFFTIQVGADGRVHGCRVTRSSGVAELDSLTCRLVQSRFRYRPSTDRYGRPIADEVDGEQDWIAPR
ncbi:TonB family protein [Sphingomonas sp. ASV193]|uniref:TonB family protein n=1 Tax=Sphingomonas sp. ASV193 TaxID=3144405 RepID=UPI0032E8F915